MSNRAVYARVLVEDPSEGPGDGTDVVFVDLDDLDVGGTTSFRGHGNRFLNSITVSDDIDSNGASLSFEAVRQVYDWTISPGFASSSPANITGEKLLELSRRCRAEVAIMPYGSSYEDVEPFQWINLFDGFISTVEFGGDDTVTCKARDLIAPLAWTFCRPLSSNSFKEKVYGDDTTGVAIETVIQAIIDDHVPAGGMKGGTPSLYTPTSPSWNLRKRTLGFQPIVDAISSKSEQIGWIVRYKWDDTLQEFRLTFYEPERVSPAVDYTFTVDDYESLTRADYNEDNIRSVCEVVYVDRTDTADSVGERPRKRVTSSDSTSIALYGERFCQITEEAASQIDTSTEAQLLADSVVLDLGAPNAIVEASLPLLAACELGDYYEFETDGVTFDSTISLAVTGYEHTVDNQTAWGETRLTLRGLPAGKVDRHLGNIAEPGTGPYAPFAPVFEGTVIPAPTVVRRTGALMVKWDAPVNNVTRSHDWSEVHVSTSAGFTPSSATLKAVVRGTSAYITGLAGETDHFVKIRHRDGARNVSASSTESAAAKPRTMDETFSVTLFLNADKALTVGTTAGDRLEFDTLHTETQASLGNVLFAASTADATIFTAPWTGMFRVSLTLTIAYTGAADSPVIEIVKNGESADGTGLGTVIAEAIPFNPADALTHYATFADDVYLQASETLCFKASDTGKCTTATQKAGLKRSRLTISAAGTAD